MSGPLHYPGSDLGRIQGDISRLEQQLNRKADDHEISTLNSNISDLARSVGELSSVCDGILNRLEACEEELRRIQESQEGGE